MKGRNIALFFMLAALCAGAFMNLSFGQYWFQTGAAGTSEASHNTGASLYIQTVYPQQSVSGSFGFWVGETLQNGAFIQVGYEVPNASGDYPSECNLQGCNGSVYLSAGSPTWFWEYFPASSRDNSSFYGGIGPSNSVGVNGTFNRYWFVANGTSWDAYVNDNMVGSVQLGAVQSGNDAPVAYAELAGAVNNYQFMNTVMFKNLSYKSGGSFNLLKQAYAYVGYGIGSQTRLRNPYNVAELPGYADFFEVGTSVPMTQNGTRLWNSIYGIDVYSQYGNATGTGYYSTFSAVNFSVPKYVYINSTVREAFAGWVGSGPGAYTGPASSASANMLGNITETATWVREYYLSVSSEYGDYSGGGWHAANSTAIVSLDSNVVNISAGSREAFSGWSTGQNATTVRVQMTGPKTVAAFWRRQYYLGLETDRGVAKGSGWYDSGSQASASLSQDYFNQTNSSRIAFYSWSDLYNTSNVTITMNSPLRLDAVFRPQYLTTLYAQDNYFKNISADYFYIGGMRVNRSVMLFAGVPYNLSYVFYKGAPVPSNMTVDVNGPSLVGVRLPVYNIGLSAKSLLGNPLNASFSLVFRNGTRSTAYTGRSGQTILYDVPLGDASGTASYGAFEASVKAVSGSDITVIFITPIILAPLIAIIAAMALILLLHKALERRRLRR